MARQRRTTREAAVGIIARLREAGHVAYLAGGCVRDALLGIEPKDYDVATDARPKTVRSLFTRSRLVGEAFGVVLVSHCGHQIEVATFRTEWGYSDGRRPDEVAFTDAQHDARRRDFTINGLFADPTNDADRIIDYVNGQADLQARVIRAIGDPAQRFGEDYLRMLRAVRFAARLDFQIEPATASAIPPLAHHLGKISRERIGQEVMHMLGGPRSAVAAGLIGQLMLDTPVLDEEHQDTPPAILAALSDDALPATPATALVAWMLERHVQPTTLNSAVDFANHHARRVLLRWRRALSLSNGIRDQVKNLLELLAPAAAWLSLGVAKRKRLLAASNCEQLLLLLGAIDQNHAALIESDARPLRLEGVCPAALIDGDDLLELGFKPGPAIGRLLDRVYDAQLEGKVTDRQQALAWITDQPRGEGAGLSPKS